MRLIDANALMERLERKKCEPAKVRYTEGFNDALMRFRSMVHGAPTVDAVPVVHGHWEIVPNDENTDGYYKMRCSVCGEILWSIQSEELYCCKCGAKMDECADGERRTDG